MYYFLQYSKAGSISTGIFVENVSSQHNNDYNIWKMILVVRRNVRNWFMFSEIISL